MAFSLRYIASQLYFALQSYICLRQVILLTPFAVVVRSNTHFAYSLRSYSSTHFFEDETRGAAATRKRTPSTRQKYAVAGALCFFLHQSDKWHNEATPLNVRAVSVALPAGLCRRQKGETREEGGHILSRDYTLRAIAHFYFLLTISPVLGSISKAQ